MEKSPILITGAGPTGLTLANLLARMNIPFFLIDRKTGPSRASKAFGIHARSLEIFSQLEIADKAIQEGSVDNTVHFVINNRVKNIYRFRDYISGKSNYPYFLILEQNKIEQLLIDSLESNGESVQWQHELVGFENHKKGVTAIIKTPSGEEKKMEFKYLAGCDGAGSKVRESAGIPFKGKTFSSTYYLADCELEWPFSHGNIYTILSRNYMSGIFSFNEKGKYRIFNFMNTTLEKEENARLEEYEVQKITESNPHFPMKIKNMDWSSSYKIHMRYTKNFRKDNIFLAGDAAHVHTPAGGQGMNTGIQDAYNLAWKLGFTLKYNAHPKLLDSYSEERQPIAENLHNTTDRIFQLVTSGRTGMNVFRMYILPAVMPALLNNSWFQEKNFPRFSQIAIKYRNSSLNREIGSNNGFNRKSPKPGDRAPYCKINVNGKETSIFDLFRCDQYTLLICVQNPVNKKSVVAYSYFSNWKKIPLSVHLLSEKNNGKTFFDVYGIRKNAVFLIRPDGHICLRSPKIDAAGIANYFSDNFS